MLVGWKVVTIIRANGWGGPRRSQPTGWGQLNRRLRTVDRPLLRVVMKAYHLHMFLSLGNLNIQKSLKHSNTRRVKAELSLCVPCSVHTQRAESQGKQDWTELSSASSCIWTNKYKSQFKHANRKRCESAQFSTSAVFCALRARAKRCVSKCSNTEFDSSYWQIHSKYPSWRVSSKKLSVMSEVKVNSLARNCMCIIILDALSLKVTASNLLKLSESLMLIQENERKKITHRSWLNYFVVLTIIHPQTQSNQKIFRHIFY